MPPWGTEIPVAKYLLHRLSDILLSKNYTVCSAADSTKSIECEDTVGFTLEYMDHSEDTVLEHRR